MVALFGARLCEEQLPRVDLLAAMLGVERFLVFYDRDQDGTQHHGIGAVAAADPLGRRGFEASTPVLAGRKLPRPRTPIPAEFSLD